MLQIPHIISKSNSKTSKPRLKFVPRPTSPNIKKVKPTANDVQHYSTPLADKKASDPITPALSGFNVADSVSVPRSDETNAKTKTPEIPTSTDDKTYMEKTPINEISNEKKASSLYENINQTKITDNISTDLSRTLESKAIEPPKQQKNEDVKKKISKPLTENQKLIILATITGVSLIGVAVAIIIPIMLLLVIPNLLPSESSFTNTSVSACATTTCIRKETPYRTSMTTLFYAFDGNTNDQYGYNTGTAIGASAPGYGQGYIGQSIVLTSSLQQYIQISNVNLEKKSFTIQAWIAPGSSIGSPNDFAIFGQCDGNLLCLSLSLRNGRVTLSFDSMNTTNNTLRGGTLINNNYWTHVTAVYDANKLQQRLYVNGRIDAVSNDVVLSFRGLASSAVTTIGRCTSFAYGNSYFDGKIDQFTLSVGSVRSDCEILNDASLVAYFPFDSMDTLNDYGPNLCHGTLSNPTVLTSGRINQAISFSTNSSYFQAQCFPKRRADWSFSFSLWINPRSNTTSGSLIHLSFNAIGNGTYCYDVLTFATTGRLVAQWLSWTGTSATNMQGPVISVNTWTHIALVYSYSSGVRLFINGEFYRSSSSTTAFTIFDNYNMPQYITIGNIGASTSISCVNGSTPIAPGAFDGSIDDFRLYNRELDGQEICVLANP